MPRPEPSLTPMRHYRSVAAHHLRPVPGNPGFDETFQLGLGNVATLAHTEEPPGLDV